MEIRSGSGTSGDRRSHASIPTGFSPSSRGFVLSAVTFTVTNTNDAGAGSLRQAILDANANAGPRHDRVRGLRRGLRGGICTITPQSALHWFTSPVTIDGYTQDGATPNTNASGAINAVLKIVVSGVSDPNSDNDFGLQFAVGSDGSTVRGLVVNGWDTAIYVEVANVGVRGCFIGTDASGMTAVENETASTRSAVSERRPSPSEALSPPTET